VSRERTEMISPEIQRDEITRYAEQHGWKIVQWFEDLDISGRKFEQRPALQTMLTALDSCKAVIVYRLDRFTREPRHYYPMVYSLQETGVQLHDASEGQFFPGPELEFIRGIKVLVGWMESQNIGKRMRDAHARIAREGKFHGGYIPFGYRLGPDGHGIVPDPDEAAIVLQIHERYQRGWGMHSIAKWMNEQRIPTRGGGPWYTSHISSILAAPAHVGARKVDDGLVITGAIPPIMDLETWERTQQMRAARTYNLARGRKNSRHLLDSRHVRCSGCGGAMHYKSHPRDEWSLYRCRRGTLSACDVRCTISARELDEIVSERILKYMRGVPAKRRQTKQEPDLTTAQQQIQATRDALSRLAVMRATGEIDADEHQSARAKLQAQLEAAQRRVERAAQSVEREAQIQVREAFWRDLGNLTREQWKLLPISAQRDIAHLLIERVIVYPKGNVPRVRIEWF
jgi:site-specific DNA recombinase